MVTTRCVITQKTQFSSPWRRKPETLQNYDVLVFFEDGWADESYLCLLKRFCFFTYLFVEATHRTANIISITNKLINKELEILSHFCC